MSGALNPSSFWFGIALEQMVVKKKTGLWRYSAD